MTENLLAMRWTLRETSNLETCYVHVQIESLARVPQNGDADDNNRRYKHGGCRYYGTIIDIKLEEFSLFGYSPFTAAEFLLVLRNRAQMDTLSLARTGKTYSTGWVEVCNMPDNRQASTEFGWLAFHFNPDLELHLEGWTLTNLKDFNIQLDTDFCVAELARREKLNVLVNGLAQAQEAYTAASVNLEAARIALEVAQNAVEAAQCQCDKDTEDVVEDWDNPDGVDVEANAAAEAETTDSDPEIHDPSMEL